MSKLQIVKNADINGIMCDFYSDGTGTFYMTRRQIGEALEYEEPRKAIESIHNKHKDRLDKFSVVVKLGTTDKKKYETYLYNAKGIYEICRWSRQPKADAFYDKVYEILEGLRLGYLKLETSKQSPIWQDTRQFTKEIRKKETAAIQLLVEYAQEHGSKHANSYYTSLSILADKTAGIEPNERNNADTQHLTQLYLIEGIIDQCIQDGIRRKLYYKDIYKACKQRLEQFETTVYGAWRQVSKKEMIGVS